jgi:hypothetical protein
MDRVIHYYNAVITLNILMCIGSSRRNRHDGSAQEALRGSRRREQRLEGQTLAYVALVVYSRFFWSPNVSLYSHRERKVGHAYQHGSAARQEWFVLANISDLAPHCCSRVSIVLWLVCVTVRSAFERRVIFIV